MSTTRSKKTKAELERRILLSRVPELPERLAEELVRIIGVLRGMALKKSPSVAALALACVTATTSCAARQNLFLKKSWLTRVWQLLVGEKYPQITAVWGPLPWSRYPPLSRFLLLPEILPTNRSLPPDSIWGAARLRNVWRLTTASI